MNDNNEEIKKIEKKIRDIFNPEKSIEQKEFLKGFHKLIFDEYTVLGTYKRFIDLLFRNRYIIIMKIAKNPNHFLINYKNYIDELIIKISKIIEEESNHIRILLQSINHFYNFFEIEKRFDNNNSK